jgi:nicotinamide riboside transporter PnuC
MNLLQYYGIDWFATVCGLMAVALLGNKNKIGFLIFMMASVSWITFGLIVGSYAIVTGSSIFFVMHLRGFLKWRRDETEQRFLETQQIRVAK